MSSTLTDGLNFLYKATPRRVWNATQIVGSYILSKLTGKARHRGMPLALSFEPTTSCNLRCPECPSGLRSFTRPTGMMQEDLFKKTIDEVASRLWYLIFYFQGEPYLHPKFLELVNYASQKGIYTATSTNAHFLNEQNARRTVESGLDRLIISLDGTTQEVYQQYRVGGKLEKVLEGTRNVVKWRKELRSSTPRIIFQFLVVRPNEHQIDDAKQLAEALGVDDVWFKTAQIYDYQNGSPLIPTIDYYSRYENNQNGTFSLKNKLVNHCWKMWHSCVVTWDGLVVPCCFDKDAEYRLGDLKEQTFASLWQGKKYQGFRKALLKGRDQVEMCRNCTEGTKVWG
ncbi:SPASM domain-containing protein [Hymenobacter sp. ASUV-10]|uniref:SPASM domain-containing protein n=1 Tax=Hymenobacter aranciens TaxID=3063996 RepID=A0ABT9BDC8_9BACT|nr:SPASM domain-containing protein [Hymenobacter sp. ASUV-10]MDO7875037.1 SPASM domain-containing protein [Hymenobacter sp. ASUV-10]